MKNGICKRSDRKLYKSLFLGFSKIENRKSKIALTIISLFSCVLFSCKEIIPDFPAPVVVLQGDTTYVENPVASPEQKNVVIEEFTGVNCVNCPQGAQIIRNIEAAHPGRIVELGLHSAFLSEPFSTSRQDFRTSEAELLSQYFIDPGFKPAAAIDRVAYDGGNPSLQYDRNSWPGYADQRIAVTTPVNILIAASYNSTTREINCLVETHFTQAVAGKTRLTVALAEDSVNSAQLDAGNVVDSVYFHRNVQRKFLTAFDGLNLSEDAEAGRVYKRNFKFTVPAAPVEWKPEHLRIIAYVHRYEGTKEVLQGKEGELR